MEKAAKFPARGGGPQPRGDCYAELLAKGLLEASSPREDSLPSGLQRRRDAQEPGLRSGIKAGEEEEGGAFRRAAAGGRAEPARVRGKQPSTGGSLGRRAPQGRFGARFAGWRPTAPTDLFAP